MGGLDTVVNAGVGGVIAKLARSRPDHVVFVDAEADVQHTAAEADLRRRQLANALLGRGLESGSRVAVMVGNGAPAAEAIYGIASAGLVQVNVNARLTASEVAHILGDSGARTVIVDRDVLPVVGAIDPSLDTIVVDGPTGPFEQLLATAPDDEPRVVVDPDAPAILIYTSGTTGRPKGVTLTHRNVLDSAANFLIECFGPTARTFLACIPYFHVACVTNMSAVMRGMTVVICDFEAAKVASLIERHAVTHVPMPPTAIAMVLDADAEGDYDLSSLQSVLYAGAPMPEAILRRAIDRMGPILEQAYGMTETAGLVTILRAGDHDLDSPARLASCGREVARAEVDLFTGDGEPAPPGTPGEIVVRGGNVAVGYWNDPEATEASRFGAWFRTGDVGVRDQEGFITVVGRIKDVIITGANNVYPVEVEKAIEDLPDVREVSVVGVPHDTWGETVAGVIVSDRRIGVDEVRAWCADRLAPYKAPRLVFQVEELPRNAIGKVDKPAVRAQLAAVSST